MSDVKSYTELNTEHKYDSKLIAILGKRGSGKSSTAVKMAYDDHTENGRKIIANFTLNFEYTYMSFADIIKLPPELYDALVILDEGFVGAGSRRSLSKQNIKMTEFVTQIRKRRCDVIIIAQKGKLLDVNIRDQVDYIINMTLLSDKVFGGIVRDRDNWDQDNNIISKFVFRASEFFKLNLFDTEEVIGFGEEVIDDKEYNENTLNELTLKQLKEKAKFLGMTRYSAMNKSTIINELMKVMEVSENE